MRSFVSSRPCAEQRSLLAAACVRLGAFSSSGSSASPPATVPDCPCSGHSSEIYQTCASVVGVQEKPFDFCLGEHRSQSSGSAAVRVDPKHPFEIRLQKLYLRVPLLLLSFLQIFYVYIKKKLPENQNQTDLLSRHFWKDFGGRYFIAYPLINCSTKKITLTCGHYCV